MTLLLIDGNSILNRAFYGIRPLSTKSGIPTNAVYGFMNILFRLLDDVKPDSACVAFDLKEPTFRHKMYSEYKAGRHPTPPELLEQFPIIKEILDAYGIPRFELAGYEADDIIGTLSAACDGKCYIATGDRDSFQLVSEKTNVLLATTKAGAPETVLYDIPKIAEVYGVSPLQMKDIKGLMGDQSDNIPGVKGVGEKTACELIKKYANLEGVYDHLDELRDSVKQKLINDRDSAFMSRQLGEICLSVPMETSTSAYAIRQYDPDVLAAAFAKYELEKFIDKLGLKAAEPKEEKAIETAGEEISADTLASLLSNKDTADIYTDFDKKAVALSDSGKVYVCTYFNEALTALAGFKGSIRTNDYKKLCRCMMSISLNPPKADFCTTIAGYLLNPDHSDYSVPAMARHLSLPRPDESSISSKAAVMSLLSDRMASELEAEGMTELFKKIELPLARVLTETELAGFLVDVKGLNEFGVELSAKADLIEQKIYELAGGEFNINSPKQLGNVLFVKMGIKNGKKTKTGYSTDAETLGKLSGEYEIVDLVLEYRTLKKLISTYVEGLTAAAGPDGRVHTTFLQTETRTGRISSREPNLQNIPVRTELGSRMRKFFTAPEGSTLIDADYSQIELRILSVLSDDENMISAFLSGDDFHRQTAARVFNIPADQVTSEIRSKAKAINFGIVYGMGAYTLAKDLKISMYDAKNYIENYFRTYPNVRQWLDNSIDSAKKTGYARTAFGRRRNLTAINGKNAVMRNFEERVAMNMPVQGTAADIIKLAMVNTSERLRREGFKSRIILQVHDELIIEAPEQEVTAVSALLKEEMENAYKAAVPLLVETGTGKTWYDAK